MTAVHATPPTTASGEWTYYLVSWDYRMADGNMIFTGTEHSTWTGTFVGESDDVFKGVIHSSGFLTYQIHIYFEGMVESKSGTLVILVNGAETADGSSVWGQWVILSGTGDLANLHGQGKYSGIGGDLLYSGQIH